VANGHDKKCEVSEQQVSPVLTIRPLREDGHLWVHAIADVSARDGLVTGLGSRVGRDEDSPGERRCHINARQPALLLAECSISCSLGGAVADLQHRRR
jgi:hypothetical protein